LALSAGGVAAGPFVGLHAEFLAEDSAFGGGDRLSVEPRI